MGEDALPTSGLLQKLIPALPSGKALDIATGTGRRAMRNKALASMTAQKTEYWIKKKLSDLEKI